MTTSFRGLVVLALVALAVSAPSVSLGLEDSPPEPGSDDWNRLFAWAGWLWGACTWGDSWSSNPETRDCGAGVTKSFSTPNGGIGFVHEWSQTWELW